MRYTKRCLNDFNVQGYSRQPPGVIRETVTKVFSLRACWPSIGTSTM